LFLARRRFDYRLVPLLQECPLTGEDLVVQVDDFGVAHLREAKPYRDARAGEVRVKL
jgi:hypothetical protein